MNKKIFKNGFIEKKMERKKKQNKLKLYWGNKRRNDKN